LIDRIEITKGPASSIYGSEAMGGVINIITKNALQTPNFSTDIMTGSPGEINLDLAKKMVDNKNFSSLLSLNYFYFGNKLDQNKDNFTDTALQHRISIFNKWNFKRKDNRLASFALRYFMRTDLAEKCSGKRKTEVRTMFTVKAFILIGLKCLGFINSR
jgi:outer membrane receptor for ferrienterochelin and colicins